MVSVLDICWAEATARICCTAIFKVRVHAGLFRRDPAGRVIDEHHLEKIKAGRVKVGAESLGHVALPFGERRFEVGKGCHARPLHLGRGSKKAVQIISNPLLQLQEVRLTGRF